MKKGLFTLLLMIVTELPALAAPTNTSGPWGIDAGGFNNLSTALASPATAGKTVVISKPMSINTGTTDRIIKCTAAGRINVASSKIFTMPTPDAGRHHVFNGAGTVVFSSGDTVFPEWKGGGVGKTAAANTAALQWAIDTQIPVSLTAGTYDFTALVVDGSNKSIIGRGRSSTILQTTAGANTGIIVASAASSDNIVFRDFQLRGTSGNTGGLQIGTVAYPAFSISLSNFSVQLFSTGFGLSIVNSWWVDSENSTYLYNFDNIYSPTTGFSTSLTFRGIGSIINGAVNRGVNFLGNMQDVVFDRVDMSNNTKEAIWFQSNAVNPGSNNIVIRNCYIEDNSDSGTGDINISGTAGTYNFVRATIEENFFHPNTAPSGNNIVLDYTRARIVNNNGLNSTPAVLTTANSDVYLENNRGHQAADNLAQMRTMLGRVTGLEYGQTLVSSTLYGSMAFEAHNSTFGRNVYFTNMHLLSTQTTAPTVAVVAAAGTGATASLSATSTDLKGQVILNNGSAAWSTGVQATVTFNTPYNTTTAAPTVLITQAASPGGAYSPYVVESSNTGFSISFGIAASSPVTTKWNYLVIQ